MRWVLQNNLGPTEDLERMRVAIRNRGLELRECKVIPFSEELPDIALDGEKTIFYGATNWTYRIYKSRKWDPAVYFDDSRFTFSAWRENLGSRYLLNGDAEVMTLEEIAEGFTNHTLQGTKFIRPNRDMKEFAGDLVNPDKFLGWYDNISHGGYTVDLSCPAVVASPKNIDEEFRVFVVDGQPVTASLYRVLGRLRQELVNPAKSAKGKRIMEFAEEVASLYSPAPVFVVDVGTTQTTPTPYVIEFNCFNSSGFYHCDIDTIIDRVSAYEETHT